MKGIKLAALLSIVAMSSVLVYGFTVGDFFEDGAIIINNPWGIVSLVDLYTGFVLFSLWIVYRESSWFVRIPWIVAVMVFGALTFGVYILYAALSSENDILTFFLGSKRDLILE